MFSSAKQLFSGEQYEAQQYQQEALGTLGSDQYGDLYVYAKAGASNISAGKLQLAPAPKTNHHNCVAGAAVTADGRVNKVTIDLGATALTANEYAGGLLIANDNGQEGTQYRISGHPAADSGAIAEFTVERPFLESIATTHEFTLMHNPYRGVVEGTSSTQQPVGVPMVDITATYFGWLKVRGIASVLADETITLGAGVTAGTSTAGAVEEIDQPGDTTVLTDHAVGWAVVAGVDTEYRPIELTLR